MHLVCGIKVPHYQNSYIHVLSSISKDPKVLTNVPQVKNFQTPIMLDGLNCRSTEARLSDCERGPVVEYCSHSDDVGAFCTNIKG